MDPITLLRKKIGERTQREIANSLGITEGYLSLVLSGSRAPGPKILRWIGLKKVVERKPKYLRLKDTTGL